jgi:hypothetical protein
MTFEDSSNVSVVYFFRIAKRRVSLVRSIRRLSLPKHGGFADFVDGGVLKTLLGKDAQSGIHNAVFSGLGSVLVCHDHFLPRE